jgi:hypothetical protein
MELRETIRRLRLSTLTALLICASMLWLMSEQNRTIAGQQMIIQMLYQDSQELNRLRMEELVRQRMRKELQKTVPKDAAGGCLAGQTCG